MAINSNETGEKTTPGKLAKELVSEYLLQLKENGWDEFHQFSPDLTDREVGLVTKQVHNLIDRLTKKLG